MSTLAERIRWGLLPAVPVPFRGDRLDGEAQRAYARWMAGQPVEVVTADATALPLPSDRFSAAACFTMLHHIPDAALQDAALLELARVLRPGGLLLGTDGEDTPKRRALSRGRRSRKSRRPTVG